MRTGPDRQAVIRFRTGETKVVRRLTDIIAREQVIMVCSENGEELIFNREDMELITVGEDKT